MATLEEHNQEVGKMRDKQLRKECLLVAAESLKGAPVNMVIQAADKMTKYVNDGTVPQKESDASS